MRLDRRREKVFGPRRQIPLDRNQKARIAAYARAWDRQHRQPGQRGGALGRAALDVLGTLLWMFHNARSGCCFPSYERIADKAGCARSTVATAVKALEWAGVLTWQNRIVQRTGTPDQEVRIPSQAPVVDPNSALERVLARLGATIAAREAPV